MNHTCVRFAVSHGEMTCFTGTASVARGLSNYIDALIENVIGNTMRSIMPIDVPFLSEYPDFFAFGMVMLLVALLCVGVRESSILNNVFTVVNLTTIAIVIIAGSLRGKPMGQTRAFQIKKKKEKIHYFDIRHTSHSVARRNNRLAFF